jgi:hypothetical protein
MWSAVVLLTGCAICAALCGWFAYIATSARDSCAHSEARLQTQRGRIVGLAGALENLHAQHRKLAGRVYADKQWRDARASGGDFTREDWEAHGVKLDNPTHTLVGVVCDNWRIAQVEGPTSQAARCECAYCVEARANRAHVRSQLLKNGVNLASLSQTDGE